MNWKKRYANDELSEELAHYQLYQTFPTKVNKFLMKWNGWIRKAESKFRNPYSREASHFANHTHSISAEVERLDKGEQALTTCYEEPGIMSVFLERSGFPGSVEDYRKMSHEAFHEGWHRLRGAILNGCPPEVASQTNLGRCNFEPPEDWKKLDLSCPVCDYHGIDPSLSDILPEYKAK